MYVSRKCLVVSALSVAATFGAASGFAQNSSGADYHPLTMTSSVNPDVRVGAMQAARPTGSEAIGQSTGAPAMNSQTPSDEVYKGAVAASHASGTEAIGQSTGMPMVGSGQSKASQNGQGG